MRGREREIRRDGGREQGDKRREGERKKEGEYASTITDEDVKSIIIIILKQGSKCYIV